MRSLSLCILGGTGFVGTHLASRLIRDGHRVRILTRNRFRHRALSVLPGLELLDTDVHDAAQLSVALRGQDVAINLIGILNERGHDGRGFLRAHTELATTLVGACRSAGVPRLLQMSSLRASRDAPSHYLRSKALAEQAIRAGAGDELAWTIFRPSVIFGRGDSFLNRFAALLRFAPMLPLARAGARFQPIWVGDVVEAMARSLERRDSVGATYELGGPDIVTLAAIVRYVGALTGRRRPVIGLPDSLGRLQAALLDYFPGKPLSLDNFRSLLLDSICSDDGCGRLGITPATLTAIVPTYLGDHRDAVLQRESAAPRLRM
ncbi:MAG: complex I NDUFA9 subunit family protein [Pseudomonadota bacterium]